MTIETHHLRYAITALEQGSIRKAALKLGVQQMTIVRHIEAIENRIGYSLFTRRRDGVHPTDDGGDFMQAARRILRDMESLTATTRSSRHTRGTRISIGFYTSVSTGNLRATLSEFRHRHPDLQWRLFEGTRRELLAEVGRGQIDIVIVTAGDLVWPEGFLPLWPERCVAVLPTHHPLAAEAILEWSMLKAEHFLVSSLDPGQELTRIIRSCLHRGSHHPALTEHEITLSSLRPFVGEGRGIMIDCESSTGETLPGVTYREIRHENIPSELRFAACWLRNNPSRPLASFLALLRERYPDLTPPASPGMSAHDAAAGKPDPSP
ncbi:LysR family transcriptional regulator [Komagataeibacter oboediens]|uniref:LysR substrate-binding domain-containing protein n=1 Tax=Komagataeibacter oboediens TaxID=65958 RepID=UPI001C2B784C|nr:LysR family transcriptional regulator [Komagataeibacter oboediens]MBV0888843.1 LysR family transcriptional regulator [Komagataeibacter oboediens]MCK9821511.1 LysR substrate-binding domain-containing protein [Komagataeibacter oboediens]